MTSILTNMAAMAALQTLRMIGANMADTQRQVSSGLRVQTAADNAAYWSISTTMRSDNMALSAVSDALGLGAAKVDVAYPGMESTIDVLSEFRAKLVAAKEDGLDRGKIQTELDQLKDQLLSVATSASFNGVNWLNTDAPQNLWELSSLPASITSSFIRSADGSVRVGTTDIDIADISLFNVGGGGALQKDIRSLGDIGGFRGSNVATYGDPGYQDFDFTGAFTLSGTDTISFNVLVDGSSSYTVTIDEATINAALSKTDGTVSNDDDFARVLRHAFGTVNDVASVILRFNGVRIQSVETTGSSHSSIEITGVTSNFGSGNFGAGLENGATSELADDYPQWSFNFSGPFNVYRDVEFSFDLQVGTDPATTITVTRDMVDTALGTSDGKISSAADMATLLDYVLDGKGLNVTASGTSILFDIDKTLYPDAGRRAFIQIGNVTDNLGPAPDFDILDVDITDPANDLDNYLTGVDAMLQKVISGASALGAVKTRIDMQTIFTQTLMDSIDKGIGRLIDDDMNEASTRLKALQTQEQLAIQSLSIANASAGNMIQLFQ
ncbi:flagellin [Rhizobium sp. S95]|uniref:Flagellin n=1 Tax=Ciceribacter sichuanensis TaxID=2949647 RepID=A0AAJ1BWB4_9HYPH|nr:MULTISPECIES: flagellin [unclassified Ciceribacter]MCM2398747.1 flagellin [Ciceribacter sp. S95]MCO5957047.1 flagellin [Ciceribacter sp. S101]